MTQFIRVFWLTGISLTVLLVLILHLAWMGPYQKLPPRPPLAFLDGVDGTYLSGYDTLGSASMYLYRFGMFGMRAQLQKADVLLLGSSHVEFGISAAQLSGELSAAWHRPVRVYNLGMGYAEGSLLTQHILKANDVRNKMVIDDLFSLRPEGLGDIGQSVERTDALGAYLEIWNFWLKVLGDWCLDPVLPHFHPGVNVNLRASLLPQRFLNALHWSSWETGDVVDMWAGNQGSCFANPDAAMAQPYEAKGNPYHLAEHVEMKMDPAAAQFFPQRNLQPIYTLLPFDGYDRNTLPTAAMPFVPVSSDGLIFFDQMHATAAARAIMTRRLFEGIEHLSPAGNARSGSPK